MTNTTSKAATTKAAGKAATKDVLVTFARKGSEREQRNALLAPVVLLDELTVAGATMSDFVMNLLAGRIDPRVTEAAKKRGGLRKLLADSGAMSLTDTKALGLVLAVPPAKRVKAWEAHADTVKRFRGVSLQGIAKGLRLLDKPIVSVASSEGGDEVDEVDEVAGKGQGGAAELAAVSERAMKAETAYKALVACVVRAVSDPGMTPAQRLAKIKALAPIADAIDAETP